MSDMQIDTVIKSVKHLGHTASGKSKWELDTTAGLFFTSPGAVHVLSPGLVNTAAVLKVDGSGNVFGVTLK